jgi:hypothetical protein
VLCRYWQRRFFFLNWPFVVCCVCVFAVYMTACLPAGDISFEGMQL